ncbi:MAG: hypothetical protein FJY98_00925 [Candidatus Liptonbacteria bacterium]|nr:hypothetical protein [Candidatus Liptonbacteria bacterium]
MAEELEAENGERSEPEPKISVTETLLIGFVFAAIDAVEIGIIFVGLDDFWILDTLASTIFVYLFLKGIPPIRQLITWLLELFPWLGAAPLLTAGWIWTVYADHNPNSFAAKAVNTTVGVSTAMRGGGTMMQKVRAGAAAVRAEQTATHGVERSGVHQEKTEKTAVRAGGTEELGENFAQSPAKSGSTVSDEAMGAEKDPLEKLQEVMTKMPEPEKPRSKDD